MLEKVQDASGAGGLPKMEVSAPLPERLQQILEQAIVTGDLEPGTKINVNKLVRELGVSAIPVREALRALSARGWVTIKPHFGAYVRERSWKEAADLHETREILESKMAALAAKRRTEESLIRLRQLVAEGNEAANRSDPAAFSLVNASFHHAIGEASQNIVLAELHDQLTFRIQFYFASAVSERFVDSAAEHEQIFLAIEAGDSRLAARLARLHAAATSAALETALTGDHDKL